jgi:hypothetical protein
MQAASMTGSSELPRFGASLWVWHRSFLWIQKKKKIFLVDLLASIKALADGGDNVQYESGVLCRI